MNSTAIVGNGLRGHFGSCYASRSDSRICIHIEKSYIAILKLTATIALLAILVFNWVGYHALTGYLQHRASAALQARIYAGDYAETSLIELCVPMDIPYATQRAAWEHFEGDIEIGGIHYRYVQRKLEGGMLYVRCLPNGEKQQVLNARDAFVKLANSMEQEKQPGSAPVYVNNYIGDYDDQLRLDFNMAELPMIHPLPAMWQALMLSQPFTRVLIKPPCRLGRS